MNSRSKSNWRLNKLVDRPLQLRLAGWFVVVGVIGLGLQYVLTVNTMADVALQPHETTAQAYDAVIQTLLRNLGICLLIILPLTTAVGILATFRLLGPISAIRRYLTALDRGESTGPLRLRKGDELQDLCELLNRVTRPETEAESERRDAA